MIDFRKLLDRDAFIRAFGFRFAPSLDDGSRICTHDFYPELSIPAKDLYMILHAAHISVTGDVGISVKDPFGASEKPGAKPKTNRGSGIGKRGWRDMMIMVLKLLGSEDLTSSPEAFFNGMHIDDERLDALGVNWGDICPKLAYTVGECKRRGIEELKSILIFDAAAFKFATQFLETVPVNPPLTETADVFIALSFKNGDAALAISTPVGDLPAVFMHIDKNDSEEVAKVRSFMRDLCEFRVL